MGYDDLHSPSLYVPMSWEGENRRKMCTCSKEKDINEIHQMLHGNGNPESGLLWIARENRRMISDNTQFILKIKKFGWLILTALAFTGGSGAISVTEFVAKLMHFIK